MSSIVDFLFRAAYGLALGLLWVRWHGHKLLLALCVAAVLTWSYALVYRAGHDAGADAALFYCTRVQP